MAEYYPLISRAVANLGESTPEQRKALYARAMNALVAQLRSSDPPIPEAEIALEESALEDAIKRVETDIAGGVDRAMLARDAVAPAPAAAPPEPQTSLRAWQERRPPESGSAQAAEPYSDVADEAPAEVRPAETAASDRARPLAPRSEVPERSWIRATVIVGAIAVVVGLTATAAMMLKHQPSDFAPQQTAARPAEGEGKMQERLGAEPPPAAPAAQPAAPTAPAQNAQAPAAPGPSPGASPPAQGLPAAFRAALIEQPPEGSQDIRPIGGKVAWRLENVAGGPGEPLDAGVRADIDVPEAGFKVGVLIRRNRDGALPASHTVELTFISAGEPNGPVREVAVPEMRQDEAVRGTPLSAIAVPVKENLFLIGLSSLTADVQRNIELIRNRNWWVIAFRYANGRRAILLFEKGAGGERTVADALQAWK